VNRWDAKRPSHLLHSVKYQLFWNFCSIDFNFFCSLCSLLAPAILDWKLYGSVRLRSRRLRIVTKKVQYILRTPYLTDTLSTPFGAHSNLYEEETKIALLKMSTIPSAKGLMKFWRDGKGYLIYCSSENHRCSIVCTKSSSQSERVSTFLLISSHWCVREMGAQVKVECDKKMTKWRGELYNFFVFFEAREVINQRLCGYLALEK
jgi:hypothetical protein